MARTLSSAKDISTARSISSTRGCNTCLTVLAFFGLLAEFFGSAFRMNDFIYNGPVDGHGDLYVTTERLLPLLHDHTRKLVRWKESFKWMLKIRNLMYGREEYLKHCLRVANLWLGNTEIRRRCSNRPVVFESCCALGEALQGYQKSTRIDGTWLFFEPVEESYTFLQLRLRNAGWCPSFMSRCEDLKVASVYFLSHFPNPGRGKCHRDCCSSRCNANQIRKEDYFTKTAKHINSECAYITADAETLITTLKRGRIPLISGITDDDTLGYRIEFVDADADTRYIAVSHVWSDGMGNPNSKSLPLCQLQVLIERCREAARCYGILHPLIWLDTICCPIAPSEGHKLIMNMMRRIYHEAYIVLVLDTYMLEQHSSMRSERELMYMLLICRWFPAPLDFTGSCFGLSTCHCSR